MEVAFASQRRAREVGERICAYWQQRGYEIHVRVECVIGRNSRTMHCVRSDLINGLPRDWRGGAVA
jgi:hypothetical protein